MILIDGSDFIDLQIIIHDNFHIKQAQKNVKNIQLQSQMDNFMLVTMHF